MLKDITLGQFFPGTSIIHRLDPRTKLVMLVVYIVVLFMANGFVSYGILLIFLLSIIRVSRVPGKAFLRGMKPLLFILIFKHPAWLRWHVWGARPQQTEPPGRFS
jgi:energy-coupling factor transport system permease protein